MKRKMLGVAAAAVAAGLLSTSAFAVTPFGNNSQKGSLLIYPDVRVGAGADTIITMTNDSSQAVRVKCYWETSAPIPTPSTLTVGAYRNLKHFVDFTLDLTHNQSIAFSATTGAALFPSQRFTGASAFGTFPDGFVATGGALKCWAATDDGAGERSYNHLFGTASVIAAAGGAYEYTAWTFQNLTTPGTVGGPLQLSPTPGVLALDGIEYDPCPAMLLGNFFVPEAAATRVTLASCNQDLRQAFTPTITKLTWTFWSQDENARTGTHTCADSWFETTFPTTGTATSTGFTQATLTGLGTASGYFRIESTPDTQVCNLATVSAYVGVKSQSTTTGASLRGTNLTGRGIQVGRILYDVQPGDSFKQ